MPTEYRTIYELTLLEWEEMRDAANKAINEHPRNPQVPVAANKLKWMLDQLKRHVR